MDQNTSDPVQPNYSPTVKGGLDQSDPPVAPKIPPTPVSQTITYRCEHETPKWKKRLEYAAVFIALGLLLVNIFQMRATQTAADVASKTMKLVYRPRIAIEGMTQDQKLANGRLRVTFSVLNEGPFAARNVKLFRFDNVSTRAQAVRLPYGQERSDLPKTIRVKGDNYGIEGEKIISDTQLSGLKDGTLFATFSVLIEYEDDFSQVHHAETCTMFTFQPYNEVCPWPVQND
jgi:hypothetical protein